MSIKEFKSDLMFFLKSRFLLVSSIIALVVSLILIIILIASIHQSDIRLVVRYSSFGITHFYREQWSYFINFVIFSFVVYLAHMLISIKVYKKYKNIFASSILIFLTFFIYMIVWSTVMHIVALI
jgi:hypothetical protein